MLAAQGGVCAKPDCLSTGPFEADHSTPNAWEAGKPDQLLCEACHAKKTKADIRAIAKAKRLANGRTQYDKRLKSGPKLKSNATLKSRGFDKTQKRQMRWRPKP